MRRIDSAALDTIAEALNLTGAAAGETWLEDSAVSQVLSTNELIRRGLTLGASEGIFEAVLRNVHVGAGTLVSSVTPYAVAAGRIAPWPALVGKKLDVWLIRASTRQISGAGTFKGALFANYDLRSQAFGVNNSGAAVVSSNHQPIANWDALITNTFIMGIEDGKLPEVTPFRLLRGFNPGTTLTFSSTASDIATFDCQLLLGLFPVGMGQDVSL